jgi:hypothetical protein
MAKIKSRDSKTITHERPTDAMPYRRTCHFFEGRLGAPDLSIIRSDL